VLQSLYKLCTIDTACQKSTLVENSHMEILTKIRLYNS